MTYGVINEQGDLGLGFDPVSKTEEEAIIKSQQQQEKDKDEKDK